MRFLFWLFVFPLIVTAQTTKTDEAGRVEKKECLELATSKQVFLCVFEERKSDALLTQFIVVGGPEKKKESTPLLVLRDSSETCRDKLQVVSRFFKFESRDVNGDGILDPIVLIKAGNAKRQKLAAGVCPSRPVSTAIYEVVFTNLGGRLESYEPSYPVLQRLRKLEALSSP